MNTEDNQTPEKVHNAEHLLDHVLDDTTGEVVEVTDNMRQWAFKIHNYMEADAITKAFVWSVFRTEKLYLAFGNSSMKEYADEQSSVGYSTIQSYLTIGDRFFKALKQVKDLTVRLENDPDTFFKEIEADPEIAELGKLGHRKLREIGKQGDDKIKQLIQQKEITFDDGTTLTADEIREYTTREFENYNKEKVKKLQSRIAQTEEKLKTAQNERDDYKKDKEELDETLADNQEHIKRGIELQNMFGEQSVELQTAYERIDKAQKLLREVQVVFGGVDTLEMDRVPETLQEEVRTVLRIIHSMQVSAQDRFPFLHDIDELETFPSWKVKNGEDWMSKAIAKRGGVENLGDPAGPNGPQDVDEDKVEAEVEGERL